MSALCGSAPSDSAGGVARAGVVSAPVASAAASSDSLPVDGPLLAALAARRALLLAWRCWFLALSHVAARRRMETHALLGRVEERLADAAALYSAAAALEPLPATTVPISSIDAASEAPAAAGTGHVSHILAGVSASDLAAIAALRREVAEQRLILEAEKLLEGAVAPRLRSDAAVRDAYARFVLASPDGDALLSPASLTRSGGVSLAERLDPRRALAGAPSAGDGSVPLVSGSGSAGVGLGPLLAPVPVPLKPIVLDLAFGAGVAYPDLLPLLPAQPVAPAKGAAAPAKPVASATTAAAPATAAAAPPPVAPPAPAGGLLGWLTGR